jgi:cytochrome c
MMRSGLWVLAAAGMAGLALPAATTAQQAAAQAAKRGERAFQKCYACHALGADDEGAQGPSLGGILGRPVASQPGYAYSAAMKAHARKQPRWTRAALDAFLADPQGAVPDNEMGFFGIKDPAERAALIDYLAAQ